MERHMHQATTLGIFQTLQVCFLK